jgi:hypothetical protein
VIEVVADDFGLLFGLLCLDRRDEKCHARLHFIEVNEL